MKSNAKSDKARLLAAARVLAEELKRTDHGSIMRIRIPGRVSKPQTDGWRAVIGAIGKREPRLELWLDRFSGHPQRKFNAVFYSENREKLTQLTKRVSKNLWPVRTLTLKETTSGKFLALTDRLDGGALAKPIFEKYSGETFFGIYDPAPRTSAAATARFLRTAAAFFTQVVESLPKAKGRTITRTDFPQWENRKQVKAHLRRERSSYLAAQRKEYDHYRCAVCSMDFEKIYGGQLGAGFAEAHHIVALGMLPDRVKTRFEDLVTVCANCHRMLHRMEGKNDDVAVLRKAFLKHRAAKAERGRN